MSCELDMPLIGKTIVMTRAQDQQSEAHRLFQGIGARVLDLPALVIGPPDRWEPLDDALNELNSFHWILFSSSNGVQAVQRRLQKLRSNLMSKPNTLKIAAVGRKTSLCLEKLGVIPDFVPPKFVADSLIENFPVSGIGLRILIPRVQSGGRTILADAFAQAGAEVVEVAAYESCCPKHMPEVTANAFKQKAVDAIVFTSGKTVRHTAQLMMQRFGVDWQQNFCGVKLISIGPQTSRSCQNHFQRVDQEADPHDLDGVLKACISALR
ncbi:uroporphyrinogen-III synthase [Prochlorococcus sp. MIT 1307]|uniref:uroporphyrinogen-III synthase n=1 Tax=Prochlorococcus sp. MIT 1307 TaxID=3096219 RepID=UPI002A752551|nr:uroporphyrinogen-III synthase [Prochlorococcus sp. MIT 1307]